jgi:large subunit ribosomal protein L23
MELKTNKESLLKSIKGFKKALVTEKSIKLYENSQYTFIVDRHFTKPEIKLEIEKTFSVHVISINTMVLPLKQKRVGKSKGNRTVYKKVFVQLQKGENLSEIFN